MLTIGVLLLITMVAAELLVIKESAFLRTWLMRSRLVSLGFSLALSFVLTLIFPAAGMLMFFAAIGSTAVMQLVYWCMEKYARVKPAIDVRVNKVLAVIETVYQFSMMLNRGYMWVRHPVIAYKTRANS